MLQSPVMAPKDHQLKVQEIKKELEKDERVKVAGVDLDGILRGKVMTKSKFLSILESGFGFCSVIFGWDMHDKTYPEELSVSNAANGTFVSGLRIGKEYSRVIVVQAQKTFFLTLYLFSVWSHRIQGHYCNSRPLYIQTHPLGAQHPLLLPVFPRASLQGATCSVSSRCPEARNRPASVAWMGSHVRR